MTQAALQFDAHTLLLGLLGMVCGFLAYWGTRLEQRAVSYTHLDVYKRQALSMPRGGRWHGR